MAQPTGASVGMEKLKKRGVKYVPEAAVTANLLRWHRPRAV
ncbi:hypothetical protein [Pyrobaculum aerophilum]|nr:hypothetical protein [Pyrobaculum aerophilum]